MDYSKGYSPWKDTPNSSTKDKFGDADFDSHMAGGGTATEALKWYEANPDRQGDKGIGGNLHQKMVATAAAEKNNNKKPPSYTPPGQVVPITKPLPNLAEPVEYKDDRKFAASPKFQAALDKAQAPYMPDTKTEDNEYIFTNQDNTNRTIGTILTAYDGTGGWDPFFDISKATTSQNLNPSSTPWNQEELMQQITQQPQVARNRAKLREAEAFGPNFNDLS